MLERIPIKKDYLLIAGAMFLLLAGYHLAFKKTIAAWKLHRQLNRQTEAADVTTVPSGFLERKSVALDRIISLYRADTIAFRSSIINTIASVAVDNHARLSAVPLQNDFYSTREYMLQKLGFEGNYFDLVKTLHQLEQTKDIGLVRSAKLRTATVRNGENTTKILFLELYIEIMKSKAPK